MMDPQKPHITKPLALVGMMGSGKSNLGRLLAQRLGVMFCDSDTHIEQRAGCTIPEIFERYGEAKFREAEVNVIAYLVEQGNCVIATGGGALMNADTLALLKDKTIMIWVQADLQDMLARVAKNSNRPLLAQADPAATLQNLLEARRALYEQAHIRVHNAQGRIEQACHEVLNALEEI